MNKIGLKIRAAVITTVYNKSLAVSLTTLSKFSSGEVCVRPVCCLINYSSTFFSFLGEGISICFFVFCNCYAGSEFHEYRYRQSGKLCSEFSPVLEFAISDCSVIVPPTSTGQPLFH